MDPTATLLLILENLAAWKSADPADADAYAADAKEGLYALAEWIRGGGFAPDVPARVVAESVTGSPLERALEQVRRAVESTGHARHLCEAAYGDDRSIAMCYSTRLRTARKAIEVCEKQLEIAVEKEAAGE